MKPVAKLIHEKIINFVVKIEIKFEKCQKETKKMIENFFKLTLNNRKIDD
jgi:hypothetical protein